MLHTLRKLLLPTILIPSILFSTQQPSIEEYARSTGKITQPLFLPGAGPLDPAWQMNLMKKMQEGKIPGLSVAVITKGNGFFAAGYGTTGYGEDARAVTPHSLFQAASISKSLTAFGAMLLVQQNLLSLDKDVNDYLVSWKIPENDFTKNNKVTLRQLLSHTAGTSVWGFPGYHVGAALPSLNQILDGINPPANTPAIRVVDIPGRVQQYSGGGITIVQKLIEDVTGQPFDEWMKCNVLIPLGMTESSFEQPISSTLSPRATFGHYGDGKRVDGNWHVYPEQAAAGLWTTPTDLLKFVGYIEKAFKLQTFFPLRPEFVMMMLTQQRAGGVLTSSGLGCFIVKDASGARFYHYGRNEGFVSQYFGYIGSDLAFALMANSDAADNLLNEVATDLQRMVNSR